MGKKRRGRYEKPAKDAKSMLKEINGRLPPQSNKHEQKHKEHRDKIKKDKDKDKERKST